MKPTGISATNMRVVLLLLFIMSLVGGVAIYYFGNNYLSVKSEELHQFIADNSAMTTSSSSITRYKSLIATSDNLFSKINNIYVPSVDYQQSVNVLLNNYANKSGLSISAIEYQPNASVSNTRAMNIKFSSPVNYDSFIKFIEYLDGSLPKVQITEVNISANKDADNKIIVNNLTAEVYVK